MRAGSGKWEALAAILVRCAGAANIDALRKGFDAAIGAETATGLQAKKKQKKQSPKAVMSP
jgi:hypothetical protein